MHPAVFYIHRCYYHHSTAQGKKKSYCRLLKVKMAWSFLATTFFSSLFCSLQPCPSFGNGHRLLFIPVEYMQFPSCLELCGKNWTKKKKSENIRNRKIQLRCHDLSTCTMMSTRDSSSSLYIELYDWIWINYWNNYVGHSSSTTAVIQHKKEN